MATQLSPEALDRLQAELEELQTTRIDEAEQHILDSRSAGDIAENPDFHTALDHRSKILARIKYLTDMIANADVVEAASDGIVRVGSRVVIDWGGGDTEEYLIGSIQERSDVDVLSPDSPIGRAVLGASEGDEVAVETPGGEATITVVTVGV